jgi:hypothetical protein
VELTTGHHVVHLGLDFDLASFLASKRTTPTKSPSTSFMRAVAPASFSLREPGPEPTLIIGTTSNATSATSAPSAPNDAKLPLI